ncbi:uncharacterized protein BJ171DRAFT_501827 [Polychytrium aggregatum]|uniref:uncharacterized protein n=1 Tax=Polychytrium aggregatum TaxID=110093 RepID=UPI0022FDE96A|nr:uncharacterized protein BJ171DRAFT_501827 [Polychytrium aggregatum]KAI9205348.1 hypothetical protein BJ171DRAFT_501827 [Polychytrium aggregatum]
MDSSAIIAIAVCSSLVLLALIGLAAFWISRYRQRRQLESLWSKSVEDPVPTPLSRRISVTISRKSTADKEKESLLPADDTSSTVSLLGRHNSVRKSRSDTLAGTSPFIVEAPEADQDTAYPLRTRGAREESDYLDGHEASDEEPMVSIDLGDGLQRRTSVSKESLQLILDTSDDSLPTYVVIEDLFPQKPDQLQLRLGDVVTVSMTFTDGWCHGYNMNTQKLGVFPLKCVAVIDPESKRTIMTAAAQLFGKSSRSRTSSNTSASSLRSGAASSPASPIPLSPPYSPIDPDFSPSYPPLSPSPSLSETPVQFTMVPPEQAMQVVTKSLSPERRAQFFAQILKEQPGMDIDTKRHLQRAAQGLEDQLDSEQSWRLALEAHLEKGFSRWMARVNQGKPSSSLPVPKPRPKLPTPVRQQSMI